MSQSGKNINSRIIEKKLYEIFGIRLFKKLALELEKLIHRKDDCLNINYHPCGSSTSSIQSFTGYLLFNSVWHAISLVFIIIYFVLVSSGAARYLALDVCLYILFFVHLYCVILQRYSYIRIQALVKKRIKLKKHRAAAKIELLSQKIEHREYNELREEYSLIKKIKETINNGTECLIEDRDAPVLRNISRYSQDIFKISPHGEQRNNDSKSQEDVIGRIPKRPALCSWVEKIAASLQTIFHFEKRSNILFGFCVITENKECEKAYKELIPDTSRDYAEFVFDVLFGAYQKVLLSLREAQI